jgi:hypothetical protein
MKRYRGVVVFRYYQTVEVEAESQDEAEALMFAEFNLSKADGESEVLDIELTDTVSECSPTTGEKS